MMGAIERSAGAPLATSAPTIGCCLMTAHSPSVSGPDFLRTASGTITFPLSCNRAAIAGVDHGCERLHRAEHGLLVARVEHGVGGQGVGVDARRRHDLVAAQ